MKPSVEQDFVKSCLNQLLEQGDVVNEGGRYRLSERGEKKVAKEIQKYSMKPAMWMMIEMWMGEKLGVQWEL